VKGDMAFTLFELLAVIAIIGTLAVLVLPMFGQARARAQQVDCLGNLRQIYVGLTMYTGDHNGRIPLASMRPQNWPGETRFMWFQHVGQYTGLDLPRNPLSLPPGTIFNSCRAPRLKGPVYGPNYPSYGMNWEAGPAERGQGSTYIEFSSSSRVSERKLLPTLNPETTVFADTVASWHYNNVRWKPGTDSDFALDLRHNGQVNSVLANGSARGFDREEILTQIELLPKN
jgi:type II secretory pathway pseudopilin PulG